MKNKYYKKMNGISSNEELLKKLLDYVLPFFSQKFSSKKPGGEGKSLDDLVIREKGMKPRELLLLESLIGETAAKNNAIIKNKRKKDFGTNDESDAWHFAGAETKLSGDLNEIGYSIAFESKKGDSGKNYSVELKYEDRGGEERLKVKFCDNEGRKSPEGGGQTGYGEKSSYAFDLSRKKEEETNSDYSINILYENEYGNEKLTINYPAKASYLKRREEAMHDFSDRVPGKHVDVLPSNAMGSVLGFTYLGQDRMALRDDLVGKTKKMVDIHESIHTPDEYETRVLTEWMISKEKPMNYTK